MRGTHLGGVCGEAWGAGELISGREYDSDARGSDRAG